MKLHIPNLLILLFLSIVNGKNFASGNSEQIRIEWVDTLSGDFSFRNKWSYLEGVYRNKFGQLSCDGFCPEGIQSMMDEQGRIYSDSINRFYRLIDTTHQFHSLQCDAWCYEWAGSDFAEAERINRNHIRCFTLTNSATHCSLILEIINDTCIPKIELNSISPSGTKIFSCQSGSIRIDTTLWKRSVLKAEFNFNFRNTDEPEKHIFWNGKIYTDINAQYYSK